MNGPSLSHAHGGNIIRIAAELGRQPADLLDMSSNLSPLGPPPALLDYLRRHIEEIGYL
ncbi:MAG TPA: threonine-phosphate decarboxylase, partial [Desulfobacterales bacterium]|nr:threonine-phosphate decarboxylase [Desulfobacterales bacterium]